MISIKGCINKFKILYIKTDIRLEKFVFIQLLLRKNRYTTLTIFTHEDKFIEIRPSGTDAKTKAYAGGSDKAELINYANILGNYDGELNSTYKKYLSEEYVQNSKEKSFEIYTAFATKDEDKREFQIPNYNF